MGCVLEFNELNKKYELFCRGTKQKILIDVLLNYARLNLSDVAGLLNIPVDEVQAVFSDKYLEGKSAMNLLYLFLFFIND